MIYLTILADISHKAVTHWGIVIKNEENQELLFNKPSFILSNSINEQDISDIITNTNIIYLKSNFASLIKQSINFPIKVLPNEEIQIAYEVNHSIFSFLNDNSSVDSYLQSFCSLSNGNIYSSNKYSIAKFVKDYLEIINVYKNK